MIIDEVQQAPDLLSFIQAQVDHDDEPGRFILTGSQNFLLMEQVSQTLAGRCGILHLLPFSRAELERQARPNPVSPDTLFFNPVTRLSCWKTIFTGFYPRIHERGIPPEVWLADYLRTFVERDLRRMVNIGDPETFERFLRLCAGRTGQLLNFSALASDAGVAVDTARRWISILKTSFLVFLLPAYHRNFNKRLIKSPKLYFHDTGLAAHLLGIRTEDQLFCHPARGALFENYILAEIGKAFLHHRREPPMFFWRDQTGHEIDLLIEDSHALYPIEVKSGATFAPEMLANLTWWNRLSGTPPTHSSLVIGGEQRFEYASVSIRPWFSV
ncbi:MAG: ATPase [Candidatus Ozemobacter sibiricus]|uniref:ATPase n=1 Tax=Candidatus Ozemobacter sibiricus TaxID=2268124 RepID=A0A367Z7Q2_9BACT|nr:MAG: ATPase [Candidatus Ozemobacter sibiricus]